MYIAGDELYLCEQGFSKWNPFRNCSQQKSKRPLKVFIGFEADIPSMHQPVDPSTRNSRDYCIPDIFIQLESMVLDHDITINTYCCCGTPTGPLYHCHERATWWFMMGVIMFITTPIPMWWPLSKIPYVPFTGRYWTVHHKAQSHYCLTFRVFKTHPPPPKKVLKSHWFSQGKMSGLFQIGAQRVLWGGDQV